MPTPRRTAEQIAMSDHVRVKGHVAQALLRLRSKDFFPDFYHVMWCQDPLGSHVAFRCMAASRDAVYDACVSVPLLEKLPGVNSMLWFGEGSLLFSDSHRRLAPVLWGDKAPKEKGDGYLVFLSSRKGFREFTKDRNEVPFLSYLSGELGGWLRVLCKAPWGPLLEIPVTTKAQCIRLQVASSGTFLVLDDELCPELRKAGK